MSYQGGAWIPAHILGDERLTPRQKLLAGRIIALTGERGYCWASNQYFMDEMGKGRTTVKRDLGYLVELGLFRRVVVGDNQRHLYYEGGPGGRGLDRGEVHQWTGGGSVGGPIDYGVETTELVSLAETPVELGRYYGATDTVVDVTNAWSLAIESGVAPDALLSARKRIWDDAGEPKRRFAGSLSKWLLKVAQGGLPDQPPSEAEIRAAKRKAQRELEKQQAAERAEWEAKAAEECEG